MSFTETCQRIVRDPLLSPAQKSHAPYKPRYVLPDYARFLRQGSAWLELAPPRDFDEALYALRILYHHVPSVTGMPVWLGRLD